MKTIKKALLTTLTLFIAVTMSACGGGGNGGGNTADSAVSKGVVTALGSVVVNGVTFSTNGAAVKIDDAPSAADQLKIGMIVTVQGTADDTTMTGTATEVEAKDALEGTISAVGTNTLTVMGQTVQIEDNVTRLNDDDTKKVFADGAFAIGETVEVHGFIDDNGGLRATRVAKKATGEFEVKGFVISVGTGTFGLSLTGSAVNVITVNGALPAGALVGSIVEVKASAAPVGGVVTATLVKLEDRIGTTGQKVEVEGIVTAGNVDSFTVNGQQVITSSTTFFEGGLKTDFVVGAKVEAEGPLNANNVIVATKVSFRSNIKIEGDATAASATGLTVLGKTVAINQYTRIDNGPIAVGSHVEVRAMTNRDNNLIATRVRVRNPDARAFLQAPVTIVSANSISILGTPITTNAATQFRISFDASEAAVTAGTFFAQLKNNITVVKARWATSDTSLAAEQVEIQVGKSLVSSGDITSQGVVTALGSVFVNGIRFHTGGAAVMIDGVTATEDKLMPGMVVKVRGTMDDATQTGTANLVEANNVLAGTISAVGVNTLIVMGQTVLVEDNVTRLNDDNAQKVFADGTFAVGQRVEVNGVFDDNGGLRATRVAKKAEGQFELKGFVVSVGAGSFGLSMRPGGAATVTVTGTLPAGAGVGSIVEVKANAAPVNGAVTATFIKLEDRIGFAGEKVEVEGIVMSGGTVDSFTINGQKVVTNASTLFIGGLKADFAPGIKVEAEGPLDANGAIVAVKVMFRSNIKIEDVASAASATSLTLLGKTVAINQYTRIDNGPIAIGQQVEVRAFLDRDGNLVASRVINRGTSDGRAFLQGPITAFDAAALTGNMTIHGVPITIGLATQFRVSVDSTDTPVLKDAFFAQLKANVTVVKVRWDTFTATTVAVNQAEIQLGK